MLPFNDRSRRLSDIPTGGLFPSARLTEPLSAENSSTAPQRVGVELSDNRSDTSVTPPGQLTLFSPPQLPNQQEPDNTYLLSEVLEQRIEARLPKRVPVVIRGGMKKVAPVPPPRIPHKKQRMFVSLLGISLLFIVVALSFLSASPLGRDLGLSFNPLEVGRNLIRKANTGSSSLVAQATATAIYHQHNDGYDPSSNNSQFITHGAGSLSWPLGQCTYWANYEYHLLTNNWVSWSGNANQWVDGARSAGWNVSSVPHIPSIIVLMPYVQGSSGYGHVAVVVSIIPNSSPTTVHTSNMNWYSNGGGWNKVSYADFTVGAGVYFIWHS